MSWNGIGHPWTCFSLPVGMWNLVASLSTTHANRTGTFINSPVWEEIRIVTLFWMWNTILSHRPFIRTEPEWMIIPSLPVNGSNIKTRVYQRMNFMTLWFSYITRTWWSTRLNKRRSKMKIYVWISVETRKYRSNNHILHFYSTVFSGYNSRLILFSTVKWFILTKYCGHFYVLTH